MSFDVLASIGFLAASTLARIVLYPPSAGASGVQFTSAGLSQLAAPFQSVSQLAQFSSPRESDGLVLRVAESEDRQRVRTIAYQPDSLGSGARAASEWWDQFAVEDSSSNRPALQRDVITGALTVDESFMSPVGLATSFVRYGELSPDGTSLLPAFVVDGASWQVADLLSSRLNGLHAFLTTGDDVISGSALNDHLDAGPGLNNLYGAEGSDTFLLLTGRSGAWTRRKSKSRGLLIGQDSGSKRKRFLYDPDVNIVRDFQPGADVLALASNPSSYTFVDDKIGTLVFSGPSKRNLVAIVDGVKGLGASDFQQL